MSTFTRLASGKVLFTSGLSVYGFNPNMNILPHPRDSNYIIITNDDTNQDPQNAFPVKYTEVTEPVHTDRNDLITKLSESFFFSDSSIIFLINKTGANSVKGTLVTAGTVDNSFVINPANIPKVLGIVLVEGIADGQYVPIKVSGIAEVLLQDNTTATAGYWAKLSDTVAGRADISSQFPPGGTIAALEDHGSEIGHCIETVTAGTNKLARCVIHFN